ncbi:hypothetical protein [Guptibacillus hwajinpoensis]|uniref:hypothetical protein n=1 Tax=Guptibacillus hwajinpoensis TaxID=208199 RepID=UPI00273FEC61|nr:hypothetical protein [Pseudalkalibacillus hwajinpoensis]WLR58810.1 hypothetical protein LC071_16815 [Pseudalkalibacillus hwajinpoensis]
MRKWLLALGVIVAMVILILVTVNDKNETSEKEEKGLKIPKEYNQSIRPQFHYTPEGKLDERS